MVAYSEEDIKRLVERLQVIQSALRDTGHESLSFEVGYVICELYEALPAEDE